MKLNQLEITDLRSHVDTKLEGLDRVNWFVGQNGRGKSTILDAIEFWATGACRGTDEAGRGAESLIRTNRAGKRLAARFRVSAHTGEGALMRQGPGDGPRSSSQQLVNGLTKIRPEMARAVLATGRPGLTSVDLDVS